MRCLAVEAEGRKIIIDAGLGTKQDEKFLGFYYLNGSDSLERSLNAAGLDRNEITDVILTHLHFDHCGGAVDYDVLRRLQPAFPRAVYWVSRDQWNGPCIPIPVKRPPI